jgi:hypothetical protein
MKILILEKCKVNGAPANPGDVLDLEEGVAIDLEAHGYASFDSEAPTPKAERAKHKAPAHKDGKSHSA